MIQEILNVGSIVGLLTGIYTLWDRLLRHRPSAWIWVAGTSSNFLTYVHVKNVAPMDIIILDISARPKRMEIAAGHSVKQIAGAITQAPAFTVMNAGQEKDFPFFDSPRQTGTQSHDGRIYFAIHWRRASSTWLPQFPVWVLTSSRDIERIGKSIGQ